MELTNEAKVVQQIVQRFPVLENMVWVQKRGRVILRSLVRRDFEKVFDYVVKECGFTTFHNIAGVDDGNDLGFVYFLSNEDHVILSIKQRAPKSSPRIGSICSVFPNALWHEREIVDLFGAVVEGLPPGPTYPLPDNWPAGNYPLRKEWRPEYFNKQTMTYEPPVQAEKEASNGDK